METIGVAELKSHLSAELKKVAAGETVVVLDHRKAVAYLVPVPESLSVVRKRTKAYTCVALAPLIRREALDLIDEGRSDRW